MDTTFVIEKNGFSFYLDLDYISKSLTVSLDDISYSETLSDKQLRDIENLEEQTMSRNTKKSWVELENYLNKLF